MKTATILRTMALAYEAEHHALVTEDFRQAFNSVPQTDTDDRRRFLEGAYRDLNHLAAMAAAIPDMKELTSADFHTEAVYQDFRCRLAGERAPDAPPSLDSSLPAEESPPPAEDFEEDLFLMMRKMERVASTLEKQGKHALVAQVARGRVGVNRLLTAFLMNRAPNKAAP